MTEACGRTFDEVLLSGYLDGALVQGDEQRVRVHLEDCVTCRTLVDELEAVREATMSSTFETPLDHEWSDAPRTETSRLARGLGWRLVVAWAVLVGAYAVWESWQASENLIEQLVLAGGISGFAMLFVGVVLDRLEALKTDRYTEVQK
jgi:anti-sigma factor RsiW